MRALLAKCAAVALIAAGFAVTGDAGRLIARGRGVIEATTIPEPRDSAAPLPANGPTDNGRSPPPTAAPGVREPAPETPERSGSPAGLPADAPVGSAAPPPRPDGSGRETVSVASLSPGDRILVWIGGGSTRGPIAPLAYDIVDPAAGDAIELRHAVGDDRLSAHAPRRRVRLEGSARPGTFARAASATDAGRIDVGRLLRISAVDSRAGSAGSAQETIGPVVAIEIVPATDFP